MIPLASDETQNLQRISEASLYSAGVMQTAIEYCFKILRRHLRGDRILELGPAEGVMTERLVATGHRITVVEGSELFCRSLSERFTGVAVVHSLFEEYQPGQRFDTVVLGHVLEHVLDPAALLDRLREWLEPGGCVFAAVPNARSLHRQAAVVMGLLRREDELNEMDLHHGHRRVFNPETFRAVFYQAGLKIETFGGYWLKPVANRQIEAAWSPAMLDAYMQLGERYPDIAGEIYVVAHA